MASAGPREFQPNKTSKDVPGLKVLSVVHIVLGVLSVIFGIVAVALRCNFSYIGFGIWSGVLFFILTGVLGLCTLARNNRRRMVITFLVMSIVCGAVAFQLIIASAVAAAREFPHFCHPDSIHLDFECVIHPEPRKAIDSLLVVVGFSELAISILSASLSCYGAFRCCHSSYTPVMVQYVAQPDNVQFVPMTIIQPQQQQGAQAPSAV